MRKKIFAGIIVLAIGFSHLSSAAEITSEQIKAAFLYHFFQFVEWPDESEDTYSLCIQGNSALLNESRKVFADERVREKEVQVTSEGGRCDILVCESNCPETPDTLTIGRLNDGAMLEFVLRERKLKFVIDMKRVKNSKFKISSQLLKLAEIR